MDPARRIVRKIEATIARYRMFDRGDRVVTAVSGGADSVCLLDVLDRLKEVLDLTLVVAHFDHGLRPEADDHETQFVMALGSSRRLTVVAGKADPPLDPRSGSLEEKARQARYRFLRDIKHEYGAQKIATGHTLNDQAETVLMRLLRGSGLRGLSGIQPVRRNGIVRPLIEVTRHEIESYLSQRRLLHVTDRSNFEVRHLRNDIRLNLMPRLETYQPRIIDILGRTAHIARDVNRWLDAQAETWIANWGRSGPAETVLPVSRFKELPEALKNHVVREVLNRMTGSLRRISLAHIEAVKRLAVTGKPQAHLTLPNSFQVRRVYETLIFSRGGTEPAHPYCCFVERTGTFDMDDLDCSVTLEEAKKEELEGLETGPWTACFDADRIIFPLMLRNVRSGDRFVPLGMKGHKKLKDFFVDMKIPSDIRARIPVLAQGNQLLWVCGLRMDDRFKVTSGTTRVLRVTFEGAVPILPARLRATK